ncbi:MAG: UDP-N-acetylmuramoyl-tripeptide--D-alanyl-D-alanine ligase [Candidatus Taylorbacteria bacterium]|nr:UDP-N-acetylmuramoyl-tripeptide--D-alanyl-D-alanine ligase [Candidatus Taylorbacteria bacterium]
MPIIKKILIGILTWESRLILGKYKPFVVAVTGSVGKTSTKDAIYDVLKDQAGFARKSDKSMNSEIGLPLTVIGVSNAWYDLGSWLKNILIGLKLIVSRSAYPNCLILEVGADHPGDIRKVGKWLHPDIVVITRISRTPVHVEFFRSPEEVFEEKAALVDAVKSGGTLVVFGDDERTLSLGDRVKDRNVSVVSYGLSEKMSVRGNDIKVLYDVGSAGSVGAPIGMSMKVSMGGEERTVEIRGILGETYAYPLLAAAAVGSARKIIIDSVARSLESYAAPRGRMNIIPGVNGSILIDDTYNSSPDAASAALAVLRDLQCAGSKIAVLGDMMELGKYAAGEHRRIGMEAAQSVNKLVTVGQRSRLSAEEAIKNGLPAEWVKSFDSSKEAASYLLLTVQSGDVVLVKGSQSVRMERITRALLREPEKAAKLLVRQENEWLAKP